MDHTNYEVNKIKEINEILHRQQTLEYLKTPYRPANICPDDYAKKIIGQCNCQNILIKHTKQILANFMIVIGLFCIGAITLGFLLILPTLISLDQPPSIKFHSSPDTPLGQAEIAMENGDYDTARAIFEEGKKNFPPIDALELKFQVDDKLEELRPFVCESTQQKIDTALLKLNQDS